MTVKQLITELKHMPQDTNVLFSDHSQSTLEINNVITRVMLVDFKDGTDKENLWGITGEQVVLS